MKTIGIYPGNFQPPTKAHLTVYKKLKQITGPETFIATTDRNPTPEAPLNYGDKEQVWVRHGVPDSHIVNTQDWKHPVEIFSNFSPDQTKAIFALNHKETEELSKRKSTSSQIKVDTEDASHVKEVWLDSHGKPAYFQPYKGNESSMEPISKHAYVMTVNDTTIEGRPVSTSNIRQTLGSNRYSDNQKKKFFRFVFGWFDIGMYSLMTLKFKSAHQVSVPDEDPVATPSPKSITISEVKKVQIKKLVYEILDEIMSEDYSTDINTDTKGELGMSSELGDTESPSEERSKESERKKDLVQKKKELTAQAKVNKQQRDQYATTVKNYDTFQKANDRNAINAVNKQITQPTPPTPPI